MRLAVDARNVHGVLQKADITTRASEDTHIGCYSDIRWPSL